MIETGAFLFGCKPLAFDENHDVVAVAHGL